MAQVEESVARHVASVDRAVAVLDVLAQSQSDLGTNEIARRTQINASSVSRLLATLARRGLVAHVAETGRYRLGLRLLELGNAALSRIDLRDVARPHLHELAELTGETVTLSVPGELEAVTMDFVASDSFVQSVARLGRPSVAHATAIGKVFLAFGGKLPDGPLVAYTERTITHRKKVAEEVDSTARRGWAQAVGEREIGLNALAAPIIDGQSALKGILGVQGPAGRFGRQAMRSAIAPLLSSANAISRIWTG
ncbi:MAG: IclR family transcriptional regulator [Actinobacteria bacterium]|nr:IclR family transcriptional regulator [Actinomycetota bacterium]